MKTFEEIYDISVTLGTENVSYPGDPPYSREPLILKFGDKRAAISKVAMGTHSGTHVDTPYHFIPGGKNLDELPAERWILPAQVISIKDKEAIRPSELRNIDIKTGDALLFKTDNSISGRCVSGVFSENFVYVSPETADFCVEKKVSLVGIDYDTVERYGDLDFPTHHRLLGNDILILENINLKDVPPGRYILFCPPLKMKGADGAPTRAILVR